MTNNLELSKTSGNPEMYDNNSLMSKVSTSTCNDSTNLRKSESCSCSAGTNSGLSKPKKTCCCVSGQLVVGTIAGLLVGLIVGVGIGYGIRIAVETTDKKTTTLTTSSTTTATDMKTTTLTLSTTKATDMKTTTLTLSTTKATDCSSKQGSNGRYSVIVGVTSLPVYCDFTTPGGGWLVFQRRINGSTSFYRNWTEYENGFGNVNDEFWLGNKYLHLLTSARNYKLRVDLQDFYGNARYAEYSSFSVASAATNYTLQIAGYSGNAGDSLTINHNVMQFSTFDADHDMAPDLETNGNCAVRYKGAWWYNSCHSSNLNGAYLGGVHLSNSDGIEWITWHGYQYSLKFTEMKISPN